MSISSSVTCGSWLEFLEVNDHGHSSTWTVVGEVDDFGRDGTQDRADLFACHPLADIRIERLRRKTHSTMISTVFLPQILLIKKIIMDPMTESRPRKDNSSNRTSGSR